MSAFQITPHLNFIAYSNYCKGITTNSIEECMPQKITIAKNN